MFKRFKRVNKEKLFQMYEMENKREYRELDRMCDELLKKYPYDTNLYGLKSEACIGLKKFTEGLAVLDKGIKLKPKDQEFYARKANMLSSRYIKKYSEAIKYYEMAVQRAPEVISNYMGGANALKEVGKKEQAEKFVRDAISICKKDIEKNNMDPGVYYDLGCCYDFLEEYESAEEFYDKTIELCPDQVVLYYNIINTKIELKKYRESLNLCEQALKIQSNSLDKGNIHLFMARNYALMGDKESAAEQLENARRLDPKTREAEARFKELKEVKEIM